MKYILLFLLSSYLFSLHFDSKNSKPLIGTLNPICRDSCQLIDTISPTIICTDTLTFIINTTGCRILYPKMLMHDYFDNCSAKDKIHLYFEGCHDSIILCCDDLISIGCFLDGFFNLKVYAKDEAQNIDSCIVSFFLSDQLSICPYIKFQKRRKVTTLFGQPKYCSLEFLFFNSQKFTTASNCSTGEYELQFDCIDTSYRITPISSSDYSNGIDAADLRILNDIILGKQKQLTPYLLLAADVNNSHTITSRDLVELRNLQTGKISKFKNSPAWIFIPSDYKFNDPQKPWFYPNYKFISNNYKMSATDGDFIAVKIGDLNGSAQCK